MLRRSLASNPLLNIEDMTMTKKISDPPGADPAPLPADSAYYLIKGLLKKRISIRRKIDALNFEYDNLSGIIARLAPSGSDVLSNNIDDFCFYRSINTESLEDSNG